MRSGQGARARPGGTMARPLLWSATGHIVVLIACVGIGAGRGPDARLLPVVEVLLVAGEPGPGGAAPAPAPAVLPPAPVAAAAPAAGSAEPVSDGAQHPAPAAPPPRAELAQVAPADAEAAAVLVRAATPAPTGGAGRSSAAAAARGATAVAAIVPAPDGGGGGGAATAGPNPAAQGAAGDAGGGRAGASGLLRERIQSRIVYPEEAIRRGLEGEVVLRIHIVTGGIPNEIRVARSSGAGILDAAARRGVVRAAPLPSVPGWVEVPVRFQLR